MRKAISLLFDTFLVVLLAGAVITAWQWPFATGLFPLTIAIPVLLVAAAQLARDAFFKGEAAGGGEQRERIRDIEVDRSVPTRLVLQRAGTFYLCALGFLAAILVIGFKPSVPLFMLFYFRRFSGAAWMPTLILTGLLTALVVGLFDAVLHVGWPESLLDYIIGQWEG